MYQIQMKPFPDIKSIRTQEFRGPTDYSNYVIKHQLLMGSTPTHRRELETLLDAGFRTFIEVKRNEFVSKKQYAHNFGNANLALKAKQYVPKEIWNLEFMEVIVNDSNNKVDEKECLKIQSFVNEELIPRLKNNKEKIYLFCSSGSGLSGVIAASLIGFLYPSVSGGDCLNYVKRLNECKKNYSTGCPETMHQRLMVYHILNKLRTTKINNEQKQKQDKMLSANQKKEIISSLNLSKIKNKSMRQNENMQEFDNYNISNSSKKIEDSFWIIKDKLLCGKYPITVSSVRLSYGEYVKMDLNHPSLDKLKNLLDMGVDTFLICCFEVPQENRQTETDDYSYFKYPNIIESIEQRRKSRERGNLKSYIDYAIQYCKRIDKERKLKFIHIPLFKEIPKKDLPKIVDTFNQIVDIVKTSNLVYCHDVDFGNRCFALSTIITSKLLNKNAGESIKHVKQCLKQDETKNNLPSLEMKNFLYQVLIERDGFFKRGSDITNFTRKSARRKDQGIF